MKLTTKEISYIKKEFKKNLYSEDKEIRIHRVNLDEETINIYFVEETIEYVD